MKIYTKTGDKGQTSLYKGGRVPKDAPRLEAYGTLDELNSVLGQALAWLTTDEPWARQAVADVKRIQRDLFCLGAELATCGPEKPAWQVQATDIVALEDAIDRMDAVLPPMTTFILPGGHPAGATFHVARTIARRAERLTVAVDRDEPLNPLIVQYINRLSDYLFVLARFTNHQLGVPEPALII